MKKLALAGGIAAVVVACSACSAAMRNREDMYLERSIDLARVWHSATQYYGYWDRLGGTAQWDDAYENAVAGLKDCRTDFEYLALLEEFLAVLKDGRAGVLDGAGIGRYPEGFRTDAKSLDWGVLPFGVDEIDGTFVVSECLSGSEIPLYSEILQLDGREPLEYMEEKYGNRVGAQTAGARADMLASALRFAEAGTKVRVSYETAEGESRTVSLTYKKENLNVPAAETAEFLLPGEPVYEGSAFNIYEKDGIACIRFQALHGQDTVREFEEQALPLLWKSSGCILDMRGCETGDSYVSTGIMRYFAGKELPPFIMTSPLKSGLDMRIAKQIELKAPAAEIYEGTELAKRGAAMNSGQYYYSLTGENDEFCESVQRQDRKELEEIEKRYFWHPMAEETGEESGSPVREKPCVMLIGKKTATGGECMAAMAREAGVTLIGENTAGVFGDAVMEQLENGWIVMFSAGNIYAPNGDAIWNQGIVPDIEHSLSLMDYRNRTDSTMEFAMEYIADNS